MIANAPVVTVGKFSLQIVYSTDVRIATVTTVAEVSVQGEVFKQKSQSVYILRAFTTRQCLQHTNVKPPLGSISG